MQTFSDPATGRTRFSGCAVAITGALSAGEEPTTASSVAAGSALAEALGARPFYLADDNRVTYHAAACMAANYLITLENCAEKLFVSAGMPPQEAPGLFLPLAKAALDNYATQGAVAALTGPLSRGDVATVSAHLEALSGLSPALAAVYRCLGAATLALVEARGEVAPSALAELNALLASPLSANNHTNSLEDRK